MSDEDGYPTDEELAEVKAWPIRSGADCVALLERLRSLWWSADWGFDGGPGTETAKYYISTGGWSGNEDLIDAMRENWMFWAMAWQSSRRGGHYEFEIKLK